jgi:hypothetical protein
MASDSLITLRVSDQTYSIDMQDLTWGELKEIENLLPGGSVDGANLESAHGLIALALIAMRRKNPLATIDELDCLPIGAIEIVEGDDKPLPTPADVDEASGTPTSDDVSA